MTGADRCAVCDGDQRSVEYQTEALTVSLCATCGHREARHAPVATATSDYYEHTPQGEAFLASLQVTRRRQARDILGRFAAKASRPRAWLDFGCGRGWFLDEARRAGAAPVAGFDTSEHATRWLEAEGYAVTHPRIDDPSWPDFSSLPFAPVVVSALDVIEHLPQAAAERALCRLRTELPRMTWLVVKVPVSEGTLYRVARGGRYLFPAVYRQLYQFGTVPPHYHYFSTQSLHRLLARAGFEVTDTWTDHDVDNLFHRIPALSRLPGGEYAARTLRMFPADSAIVVARVRDRADAE
jgi:hypothetical protein